MQPIARPPTKSSMNCEPLMACFVRLLDYSPRHPEITLHYTRFKFPALAYKFLVLSKNFPVPLSREFCSKPAESLGEWRPLCAICLKIEKFPVNFPVSREFGSGDGFDCDCVRHHRKNSHLIHLSFLRWRPHLTLSCGNRSSRIVRELGESLSG